MKRIVCLMGIFLALCLLGAVQSIPAQPQSAHSMKGYELYSWRDNGDWYFSLLVGTNRLKTKDEVTAQNIRLLGIEALKEKLRELPQGEEVSWSASHVPDMSLPAEEVIKEIKAYCEERAIKLHVNYPREGSKKRTAKK